MFMKLSGLKAYKKHFLFIIATFLLSFPPLFVWFSINNLQTQIQEEKITVVQNQLLKKFEAVEQSHSPHYKIFRDFNLLINEKRLLGRQRLDSNSLNALMTIIENNFSSMQQTYRLPVLASAFLRTNKGLQEFNFINDRKTASNEITELTANMYKYYCTNPGKKEKKVIKKHINQELKKINGHFNLNTFNNDHKYIDYFFYRDKQKEKMLLNIKYSKYFFANALFDLTSLNQNKLAQIKIDQYADSQNGIAFIGKAGSVFKNLYSERLKKRFYLVKRVISKLKDLPKKIISFKMENEIFLITPSSRQKDYRLLLSAPAPEVEKEPELSLLLALIAIFILAIWKTLAEFCFLDYKPQFSINFFVIFLFLIISFMPLLSSVYLGGEFLISEFKKGKHISATNLEKHLTGMDIETLANTRKSLNILKSLNTIESYKKFTGKKEEKNLYKLFKAALEKFVLPGHLPLIKEVWIYNQQRKFHCYEWNNDHEKFITSEVINPVIAENIRPRLNRYFKKMGSLKTTQLKNNIKIEMNELKLELVDQVFLYLFGQETYYKLKESIGILLKLKTFYDKNLFISIPVFDKSECRFILTYVFTSPNIRNHFPEQKLSLKQFPKTFALYGTSLYFRTLPRQIDHINKNYPEMLKVAKESHLTKYKLQHFEHEQHQTSVIAAQPANYSDYILIGKQPLKSLESIKSAIVNKFTQFILLSLVFLLIFSFVTSQYFILPIKDLTKATRQIIKQNYQVRIAKNHPDEFADMAQTFNTMARNLEEGKLLKSFVSKNVAGSLEKGHNNIKAERKNATIVFCGIKNFSNIFTLDNPAGQFEILQHLLQAASEVGEKYSGELDKMIDDKAMMVFEDLSGHEPSVDRAIKAVLQMHQQIKKLTGQNLASGINSGSVVAGVMGSEKVRLAYTVVGDPVNLAARLAAIAEKDKDDSIIISAVAANNSRLDLSLKKLDIDTVKGKTQSVKIFRLELMA
jgi:class 3 adenylate cyclase